MSPQGFFGDPTSALLPATAQRAHGASAIRGGFANGNWFFGRYNPNWDLIKDEYSSKGNKNTSPPSNDGLRARRRPSFGGPRAANSKFRANYSKKVKESEAAAEAAKVKRVMAMVNKAAYPTRGGPLYGFGTHSDSLSGMARPSPPDMRTFPMLGAYPGEVGPGILPGGTAGNGPFVGTENSLLSYYFTYGRRRSARKGARRSARKGSRRSMRRR